MTYPVFFELVCAHAKTLDQQERSSSEAKRNANQTQRQQQPQKPNKKDKKQIPKMTALVGQVFWPAQIPAQRKQGKSSCQM